MLETSICDLRNGRLTFEKRLADKLRRAGVTLKKLTDGELVKKVFAPQSSRVVDLFCSFILRAQKQMLSPADIRERLRTSNMRATKTKAFIKLAVAVYESYNRRLKKEGKTDFDRLLGDAIRRLENSRDIILWHPAWHSSEKTPISNIKWVLVDEYQDMSPLFQKIILAIKAKSNCSLYCVGDDWQAINGFAGADPRIFSTFRQTHNEAEIIPLLTTFRNAPAIVSTANQLMNTSGDGAKAFSTKPAGEVLVSDIMETPISYHTSAGCEKHDQADAKFMFFQGNKIRDPSFLKARYLKACNSIMTENLGKSFAVLSRTNALYGCDLDEFAGRLKKTLTTAQLKRFGDFSEKVYVGAVHSYKGLEADVVIILRYCTGTFPLLHPDNAIFEILDSSPKRVFEEEKRLFYVALTRAREKLIMLTETGKESVWLPPSARRVSLGKDNRAF